jgi:cytochrome c biogenesis protein CcmG/thiol:disulfide interchange protein DsbE
VTVLSAVAPGQGRCRAGNVQLVPWTRRRSIATGVAVGLVVGALAAVLLARTGGDDGPDARLTGPGTSAEIGTARDMSGESLPDLSFELLAGGDARLANYRGKPLVLNVWASWCPPCQQEMPAFEEVHRALGDRVRIVGLDRSDGRDAAIDFAAKRAITYPLLFDPEDTFAPVLGIAVMPTTLFVSADGVVVKSHAGTLDAGGLTKLIEESFPR